MQAGYMVLAKDGNEYGPLDRDTIQRWYFEGRIDRGSRVWEPGGHKFRLHEMFDLTLWSNPALVNAAATSHDPTFMPATDILAVSNERTTGMLAAAILLLISGIVELLAIAALLTQKVPLTTDPMIYLAGAAAADLIVAAGLFRGNQKFRGWGLARAVLGGLFVLVAASFVATSGVDWIFAGFQVLQSVGIASLLVGESPSKLRTAAGVSAVLLAWSGMITTGVVMVFLISRGASPPPAPHLANVGGGAAFEDFALGVKVRLPVGWTMFTDAETKQKVPNADMVAGHNLTGCAAVLVVEPAIFDAASLDEYIDLIVANRREGEPSFTEMERTSLDFGGHAAKRFESAWTSEGVKIHGFTTVCKAGSSYYLLTGWCPDSAYEAAFPEFLTLERAFEISGTPPLETDEPDQSTSPRRKGRRR